MTNLVWAASRPRAKASRAIGASKAFPHRGKALPQAGFIPVEEVKRTKVGSVALSPRGDWRMPSDAAAALWLEELEGLR